MPDPLIETIYNFLQLSSSIATSGQPTTEQFSYIRQAGYQVVINLALPESVNALPNERSIVAAQSMDYVHIPVLWEQPTMNDIDRFFAVMQANVNKSVFVHCAANKRVSAFMYLYRTIQQQVDEAIALRDLHKIWIPNDIWQAFIQQVKQQYQTET
jgi:protein tyrosine phosphatase (PTP) superfamily phosphohydrolase (DUF442 family)